MLAYSLYGFSTRSGHPKFVPPPPEERPRKDYKALAAYLEQAAIDYEREQHSEVELAAHPVYQERVLSDFSEASCTLFTPLR